MRVISDEGRQANGSVALVSRRRFLAGAAALSATALAAPAWGAASRQAATGAGTSVTVERADQTIHVRALAEVSASRAQTFATLADYDRLADFIPGLASSRTVSRDGLSALIEQHGRASFGPFEQRFTVMLAVEEERDAAIRASLAGGDFRRFEAAYEIQPVDAATTRVEYRAALEPTAAIPPLFGLAVMRGMIRSQFEAMIAEIARRGTAG